MPSENDRFRYNYYHYIRKPEKREKKFPKDLARSAVVPLMSKSCVIVEND